MSNQDFWLTVAANLSGLFLFAAKITASIERRFTRIETHMVHIMGKLGMSQREERRPDGF